MSAPAPGSAPTTPPITEPEPTRALFRQMPRRVGRIVPLPSIFGIGIESPRLAVTARSTSESPNRPIIAAMKSTPRYSCS